MSPEGTRVVGYCRTSTDDQRNGIEAQRDAIERAAAYQGWQLVTVLEEHASGGRKTKDRPVLNAAVELIEAGAADALVVAKLDRLSRSLVDFGQLVERARENGWAIIVLDPSLDMTTANGRMIANVLMSFAQWERELIGQRTKEALGVKRSRGERAGGRPSTLPDKVVARIRREADAGVSLNAIARRLNDDAIPTAQGGKQWYASSVAAVLRRAKRTV